MAETQWTDPDGKILVNDDGEEFVCAVCPCGGLYIYLLDIGGTLTVRARNISNGTVSWDYTDANMVGNAAESGLTSTSEGMMVFAADGARNIFIIDADGALVRSGAFTLSTGNGLDEAHCAADGNKGYLFGLEIGTGNVYIAVFNLTTFAVINDIQALGWQGSTGVLDRQLTVGDNGTGWIYTTGSRSLHRVDPTTLALDTEFTPLPCGQGPIIGIAIGANDTGQIYGHAKTTCNKAYHLETPANNFQLSASLLRWPCWLSSSPSITVPNSIWVNATGATIDRYSDTDTLIDTWAWSNLVGFAGGDLVENMNVDGDGNMYFWWDDKDVGGSKFTRLDADFSTVSYSVLDTDLTDPSFLNGRNIIHAKGNGRSKPSEEAW